MTAIRGVGASPGVVLGPWVLVDAARRPEARSIDASAVPAELERLSDAAAAAADELDVLAERVRRNGASAEAGIFDAQSLMALDPTLLDAARSRIAAGAAAAPAVWAAGEELAATLRALDDDLLAQRATDVEDVVARIVARIGGEEATRGAVLAEPAIVVAADIAPSVAAGLHRELLRGIVLEGGSPTAHAAILARGYGIPAVVGAAGLLETLAATVAAEIAIDGSTGEVVVAPDTTARADIERRAAADRRRRSADEAEATQPAVTTDGVEITLEANIGLPDEAPAALRLGAAGVGLFRTEFLFIERAQPPGEDEQTDAYRRVVDAFAPHTVVVRLLDVGGDKPIPFLGLPAEANPFLGVRALRIAADRPELFITQLRAIMRAAAGAPPGSVRVMAPMVADAADVDVLLDLVEAARSGLATDSLPHGHVDVGVMLEIPSAILVAPSYFGRIRFASIGTNDLTQYTLAADRGNPALGRFHDALHPAVLRLVHEAALHANESQIDLAVCGELAGDPLGALALVGCGVRQLSMAPSSLPAVRRAIRGVSHAALRHVLGNALGLSDAAAVRLVLTGLAALDQAGGEAASTTPGASPSPASISA